MQTKSLIVGEGICKNCHCTLNWSLDLDDPNIKILGGFINSTGSGNEIEITVKCNKCNKINKVFDKYIMN